MLDDLEITEVRGRKILDSDGYYGAEAEIVLENGAHGRATVVLDREDGQEFKAKELIERVLGEAVLFEDASDQNHIDSLLMKAGDSVIDNSTIYSPAYLNIRACVTAMSMAAARAAGAGLSMPLYQYLGGIVGNELPALMMTLMHVGNENTCGIDMEELMMIPEKTLPFSEQVRMGVEIYHSLKRLLELSGHPTSVAMDGSFFSELFHLEEALDLIMDAGKLKGYKPGTDFTIAVNAAADRLYERENGLYHFKREECMNGIPVQRDIKEMIGYYLRLIDGFPISVIEGVMADDDRLGWTYLTKSLGHRVTFLGHSLFRSDERRIEEGKKARVAGGVSLKLSEALTVSGMMAAGELAGRCGYKTVVSHGGRETEDSFLSDVAVAVKADYVKLGAPCRGERTEKYNELLRLEAYFQRLAVL